MTKMTIAHIISDDYERQCSYSNNGLNGTFTLKENLIYVKFSKNNIKIYEKNATYKDFTGNVTFVKLNIICDMIYEYVTSNDDDKTMTINEYDDDIEIIFDVFYGKHFSYNFQIKISQKAANENDLLSIMSLMQNDIMELKKNKKKMQKH
jgi:hypothetical protein